MNDDFEQMFRLFLTRSWNLGRDARGHSLSGPLGWLMSHARQLIAAVALVAGAYMAISGLVRPS